MSNIIFLLGYSKVGKDTITKYLEKYSYKRISFADSLKEEYAKIHNIDVSLVINQGPEKEYHRPGLIELAERKKLEHPNIWLELAFKEYFLDDLMWFNGKSDYLNREAGDLIHQGDKQILDPTVSLVVSDCRRTNEIEWIKKYKKANNITLIHVERKERPIDYDHLTTQAIELAYEYDLVDFKINNDGDDFNKTSLKLDFLVSNFHNQYYTKKK